MATTLSEATVAGWVAVWAPGKWGAFWLVGIPCFLFSMWACVEWRRVAYLEFRADAKRFRRAANPESYSGIGFGLIWLAALIGLGWRFFGR